MKVELNVRTLVVCGVVLAGLIGGSVYVGNYFFQKQQDKNMEDSLMRAVYGGTKDELAAQQDCRAKRKAEILRLAKIEEDRIADETTKKMKYLDENKDPKSQEKRNAILAKVQLVSEAIANVQGPLNGDPEKLVSNGIVQLDEKFNCVK